MTLNVETILAVSIMLSVFAAVTTVGASLFLGVGFERLRAGFEVISKQTGFFSDMLNRLEKKVEVADVQAAQAAKTARSLEMKVDGMMEQANLFAGSIQKLAEQVGCKDSLPAVEQEPDDAYVNIRRYFRSDSRKALVAASQESALKQKSIIRARMHAIAKDLDGPSSWQKPVNDLSHRERREEQPAIHVH